MNFNEYGWSEGEYIPMVTLTLEDFNALKKKLAEAEAKIAKLQDGVDMAIHFFDSPESFSNEEFQAVANRVYAADGQIGSYTGKVPYLDKYVDLHDTIKRVNASVLEHLSLKHDLR